MDTFCRACVCGAPPCASEESQCGRHGASKILDLVRVRVAQRGTEQAMARGERHETHQSGRVSRFSCSGLSAVIRRAYLYRTSWSFCCELVRAARDARAAGGRETRDGRVSRRVGSSALESAARRVRVSAIRICEAYRRKFLELEGRATGRERDLPTVTSIKETEVLCEERKRHLTHLKQAMVRRLRPLLSPLGPSSRNGPR